MSLLPAALMTVGTILSATSKVSEGNAQAYASESNAELYKSQAASTRTSGAYEESKLQSEKSKMLSTQQARYAKSGVLITEGSPLEVMADTAAEYEMDIRATRYNTETEARKYEYQAELSQQQAKTYRKSGYYGAGTTLLSGLGQTLSMIK